MMGLKNSLIKDVTEGQPGPLQKRYPRRKVSLLGKAKELEASFSGQAKRCLDGMKAAERPKSMVYFDSVVSGQRLKELEQEKASGKKIIGFMCALVPQEIVIAAGAIPVRLCSGSYDACDIAEEAVPRDICPLAKSTMGMKLADSQSFKYCDAVVVPASCDAKKKLAEVLSDYMTVFVLDVPAYKDAEKAKRYWLSEVKGFKECIEKFTGRPISRKAMETAVRLLYDRTRAFRRLYEIRKSCCALSARDAMLVANASFIDDPSRWTQKVDELCAELEERERKGVRSCNPKSPRILITGSAIVWPGYKILEVAEQSGLNIVIDQTCSGTEYLYQPAEVDEYTMEDMLSAVSERYLLPSMCPTFFTWDDRADRIMEMAEQFRVQGVIYHTLRLCQVFDMESEGIRQALQEKGIPVLKVVTDYSYEDVEQIRTRMEAFKEMIQSRQTGQAPKPKGR